MEAPTSQNDESFNLWLKSQEQVLMLVRLDTHRRYQRYKWDLNLDELVEEAFRDVYEGRRHPPANKGSVEGIRAVIKSKVSNWLTRERRNRPLKEWNHSEDPTDLIFIRCYIRELVKGDLTLMEMVELCIKDPKLKLGDLAEMMEISIKELYNARERLRRRIPKERNN